MNFCFLSLTPSPAPRSLDRSLISTSISLLRTHKLILKVENIHPLAPSKQVQEVVSHECLPMSGWSAPRNRLFFLFCVSSQNLLFFEGSETFDLPARFFFFPAVAATAACDLWGGSWRTQFAFERLSVASAISQHFKKICSELKELWKLETRAQTQTTRSPRLESQSVGSGRVSAAKTHKKTERNSPPPKKAKTKTPRTIDDAIFIYMHLLWQFALHQKFTRIFVRSLHCLKY